MDRSQIPALLGHCRGHGTGFLTGWHLFPVVAYFVQGRDLVFGSHSGGCDS